MIDTDQLAGKRIFVTGHTGFKGSWLLLLLRRLGATVTGYSLPAPTSPSLFETASLVNLVDVHHEADVRDVTALTAALDTAQPDVVFHLAAQPLVRLSYREPLDTFATNVMGTGAVLEAVRLCRRPCAVIVATSDKCYEPHEDGRPHDESDRLGGHDPYSASKGAAELVAAAYRSSFFPPGDLDAHGIQVATVRAGNVIGGGDWAEDRIVTDMVRHLIAGTPIPLRNPQAIRPWQHVLEPLTGYLALAEAMLANPHPKWCTGWNFGPTSSADVTVEQLATLFVEAWGAGGKQHAIDAAAPRETHVLRLSIDKALSQLPWRPRWSAVTAIRRTAAWFRAFAGDATAARTLCINDINSYSVITPSILEVSST